MRVIMIGLRVCADATSRVPRTLHPRGNPAPGATPESKRGDEGKSGEQSRSHEVLLVTALRNDIAYGCGSVVRKLVDVNVTLVPAARQTSVAPPGAAETLGAP